MADIFNEVDEDLRRDRAERLWRKYGNHVLALAVAIVVGTAGWTWWTDHQRKQSAAQGERFFAAVALAEGEQWQKAVDAFAAIGREGGSYALVARLHEASTRARHKDMQGALSGYRAVAGDGAADPDLRDAALLLGALSGVETLPPAEVDAMLDRLSASASPWRFTALEIRAAAALRAGDGAKARELLARVADDPGAPASLRARATEMLQATGG
ncbi:MAG: tetratricopeptide repeat protein [Alphaproteobacteria bacterium]